jgi:hypothetical protein
MANKYGSQIVYLSPITYGRLNRFCSIPSGSSGTKRVLRARLLASCGRHTCHYLSLIEAAAQADPLVFDFIALAGEFLGIRSQEVGSMITVHDASGTAVQRGGLPAGYAASHGPGSGLGEAGFSDRRGCDSGGMNSLSVASAT